jgi:hypothetical protein
MIAQSLGRHFTVAVSLLIDINKMAANEERNISSISILNEPLILHYVRKQWLI